MSEIDYKAEVLKVEPYAVCSVIQIGDVVRYEIVTPLQHYKEYASGIEDTEEDAWKSAYENLKANLNNNLKNESK